jgi:hypothetical protein
LIITLSIFGISYYSYNIVKKYSLYVEEYPWSPSSLSDFPIVIYNITVEQLNGHPLLKKAILHNVSIGLSEVGKRELHNYLFSIGLKQNFGGYYYFYFNDILYTLYFRSVIE